MRALLLILLLTGCAVEPDLFCGDSLPINHWRLGWTCFDPVPGVDELQSAPGPSDS